MQLEQGFLSSKRSTRTTNHPQYKQLNSEVPGAILNVSDDFPKTEPLNTTFSVNWPAALDAWFRALLRQKPTTPPQVTNTAWEAWLTAVAQHGMSALVYTWLLNAPANHQPPPPIMAELRAVHVANIALAERRRRQLADVVASFAQAGIHPIVLKGAALAHWLYDLAELRPSADIDLLVTPAQCGLAADVLQQLGYSFFMGGYRPYRHAEGFYAPNGKLSVDLHKALSSYVQVNNILDLRPIFANSMKTAHMNVLNIPDSLLMACMHLIYNHRQNAILIWLYDIHLLAERLQNLDQWQRVIASSIQWQARYALAQALELTRQFFDTDYPQIVHDFTYYPLSSEEDRLHCVGSVNGRPAVWSQTHLMRLQTFDNRERIRYLKNRIFPNKQEIAYFYPRVADWPLPFAYLGRWFLILVANTKFV